MSIFRKTGTAIGIATGASAAASIVASTGRDIARSGSHIGHLLKGTYKAATTLPDPLPELPGTMDAAARFSAYMARHGLSADVLPLLRERTASAAWVYVVGGAILLAALIKWPIGSGNLVVDIARLAVPVALMITAASHAYANWLYRNQRHGSFAEFVRSGDWMPRRW
jgi:hypothetical protein